MFILGFDEYNLEDIESVKPKVSNAEIRLLNYYNPNEKNRAIPDPWGVSIYFYFENKDHNLTAFV